MKRITSLLFFLLCLLQAGAINPEKAQAVVDRFVNASNMRHATLGVAVADAKTGEIIAGNIVDQSVITASTMKTVTSTAALEVLGADYQFVTPVYYTGEIDSDGTLHGNIVVVGKGDPTLGSVYFPKNPNILNEVIVELKNLGIKKIDGAVTVDSSAYPYPAYCLEWEIGDLAWDFCMGVHALNYRDNRVRLSFKVNNGKVTNAATDPVVPGLEIVNRLAPGKVDDVNPILEYTHPCVALTGTAANKDYSFNISNPAPDATLVDALTKRLKKEGIAITAEQSKATKRTLIVEHRSPQLSEIIKSLLDRSDNMFTEALLRAVSVAKGKNPNDPDGVTVIDKVLKNLGLDTSSLFQHDGSGLSRANKASARFFVEMLSKMLTRTYAGDIRLKDLMPTASRRIGKKLAESPLSKKIVLKSGSMTSVQCFVGYYPANDPQYCFAVLANNWNGSRGDVKAGIDRLLIGWFGGECDDEAVETPAETGTDTESQSEQPAEQETEEQLQPVGGIAM